MVAGITLTAINLRPALVAVAPLLTEIQADTGLSDVGAGVLTTLPVICFGLISPLAPTLARRIGIDAVLVWGLTVIALGSMLRLTQPVAGLFASTAIIGAAATLGNVLLPSAIKRDFPGHLGLMTGLYTTAMVGGAVIAAGLTVPLRTATGPTWRTALALWGLAAAIAAVVWLPILRPADRCSTTSARVRVGDRLWRDPLAWQVTAFMGLQSFNYYATSSWLPAIFSSHEVPPVDAGWLLSAANAASLPTIFVVSIIAGRYPARQPVLVALTSVTCATGILGLLLAPTAMPLLWVLSLGAGQGMALSLSMAMIVMRPADPAQVSRLSGMAQTVGYLFAATGPFAVGVLRELTGGWAAPLVLLLLMLVPMLATGLGASKDVRLNEARAGGRRRTADAS